MYAQRTDTVMQEFKESQYDAGGPTIGTYHMYWDEEQQSMMSHVRKRAAVPPQRPQQQEEQTDAQLAIFRMWNKQHPRSGTKTRAPEPPRQKKKSGNPRTRAPAPEPLRQSNTPPQYATATKVHHHQPAPEPFLPPIQTHQATVYRPAVTILPPARALW
eukprot:TRINITY_DN34587_c0_g1_i1.p2 TRINITY_DN34587_c0_g1~~TRINITY_DN34587_c0_g1_i1.p2  ORF type:complete len:159 (-),score=16.23 TRINITY_DN34587_c0_g1_i1:160-636(-)